MDTENKTGITVTFRTFTDQELAERLFQEELGVTSEQHPHAPISFCAVEAHEKKVTQIRTELEAHGIFAEYAIVKPQEDEKASI